MKQLRERARRPPREPALGALLAYESEQRRRALSVLEARPTPRFGPRITWLGDVQQGDGGKGAMVDGLAARYSIVARTQGGENAGHTTAFRNGRGEAVELVTHLLPSGMRHRHVVGVLGRGVMLNPERLAEEINRVSDIVGDAIATRLLVSECAHIVFPFHRAVDAREEDSKSREGREVGTTRRGVGPANVSRSARVGIRVVDLQCMEEVDARIRENGALFGLSRSELDESREWIRRHVDLLQSLARDTTLFLNAAADEGYSVLFEGAQGPLIDIDYGMYPYVTTCPTLAHSVAHGAGVDMSRVGFRVGVLKAYQTMVGNGPFVTEDLGFVGDRLRIEGAEYGSTTARPRRCGWLDLVYARWAITVNRYDALVVTKLDALEAFDEVRVCVGYVGADGRTRSFRPFPHALEGIVPVYRTLPGWRGAKGCRRFEALPDAAVAFAEFVASYLSTELIGVRVGPRDRDFLRSPHSDVADAVVGV